MPRKLKTFSEIKPTSIESAKPQTNSLSLDLGGLKLSEGQLNAVRQEAVKAALTAASGLVDSADVMDSFSTFSTFSTFSSAGAAALGSDVLTAGAAHPIVNRVINPRL